MHSRSGILLEMWWIASPPVSAAQVIEFLLHSSFVCGIASP
jgi:hypothetical protein